MKHVISNEEEIINTLKENIQLDDALTNLEHLSSLNKESDEYKRLYQKVISVGEYKN